MRDKRVKITENAQAVLEARYFQKDDAGNCIESPAQLFERVARCVASVEGKSKALWSERFFEMMAALRFLPNSPTLMNAGLKQGQLSACFVLPVEDSLESIFDALKSAALIHQSGGGTGFSFSKLRPKGSQVKTTRGVASGPVSFMRIFDVATETIKQGGKRRGANMAILRVDHPDILEFIDCKKDMQSITNFNISVGITDDFMVSLRGDGSSRVKGVSGAGKRSESVLGKEPGRGSEKRLSQEIYQKIVRSAWECGDPGLVFLDRINLFNPTPQVGAIESTNPCSEQPLLPYESCNLGSLNVLSYWVNGKFDWKLFRQDIVYAVRFLDNVIDVNHYPVDECRRITLRNRKIGLGIMGFADLLLVQGIPYGSAEALLLGQSLMSFLDRVAKLASIELAGKRGAFPNWKGSLWQRLGYPKMRNATVSTVAPTGTISIIAGVSSGIEPIYSGVIARNVLSGKRLVEVHPLVEKLLVEKGIGREQIMDLSESQIGAFLGLGWSPSHSLPVEAHIRMQAAFQWHTDSAVSKTINLPEDATEADVRRAYEMAYDLGCKGITVYRDKSRPTQVLEVPGKLDPDFCPVC